jgi:hypothetical protein
MLVQRGLLGERQLAEALRAQRLQGGRLGSLLIRSGVVGEDEVARCLGEQLGAPHARVAQLDSLPRGVIALLSRPLAERYRAVPLRLYGNELQVCLADPHDFTAVDELAFALDCRLRAFVASQACIDLALERYYQIPPRPAPSSSESADGWRELAALPEPPSPSPSPSPPPPPADPVVIDLLAAALCEGDVEAAFYRYFSERFRQVALVAVRGGRPVLVRAGDRNDVWLAAPAIPLRAGGLLARLLAEGQVKYQPRLTDPEMLDLCRQLDLPATDVTLVSICASDGGRYAVIGQGRDGDSVRRMFPDLRAFACKAVTALQILTLRKAIRGG